MQEGPAVFPRARNLFSAVMQVVDATRHTWSTLYFSCKVLILSLYKHSGLKLLMPKQLLSCKIVYLQMTYTFSKTVRFLYKT